MHSQWKIQISRAFGAGMGCENQLQLPPNIPFSAWDLGSEVVLLSPAWSMRQKDVGSGSRDVGSRDVGCRDEGSGSRDVGCRDVRSRDVGSRDVGCRDALHCALMPLGGA